MHRIGFITTAGRTRGCAGGARLGVQHSLYSEKRQNRQSSPQNIRQSARSSTVLTLTFWTDGTSVNTVIHAGTILLFELARQRPVHWMVCQLHANELNLREVFRRCDDSTSGPRSFTGPVGRDATDGGDPSGNFVSFVSRV